MSAASAEMILTEAEAAPEVEQALADLRGHMNLALARVRSLWKESAASLHPDLQVTGYKLLMFIDQAGTTHAHELSERLDMDKSVISRQVRMLESAGLLESRPDERDGRLRVLSATPRASAALRALSEQNAARMRKEISELSVAEIRAASKVFRLLSEI
ncbi:MarR family winged helix-turn-helix transcriptional regulator [Microbacterium jiangjiandongii]|uniref:MarR family winged helix-turn-helix transcriptional regulator n=1 Tax=Microbacterium jiangjiandongii TaxID=3049071 RepID=UPI00214BE1F9|nr:MarR family transcriptional regulator [Microbacterium sp. zg.Y843]MCR2816673.1 MarR family transcriptional regulator [Microbacterium sp. zg.Y843]